MSDSDPPPSNAPPPSMTAITATLWMIGATFALSLLASIMAAVRGARTLDIVSGVACQAAAYLLTLFLILRVHAPGTGARDLVGLRPTHPLFYPLAVLLGISLQAPANALNIVIERRWPSHAEDTIADLVRSSTGPQRALAALAVILAGPMLEELLFRGALFRPMLRSHSSGAVIVVTATLFAIAHHVWQVFLPIGILGLVLGAIRRASGSIVPSMLLHATFNAIPFYAMVAQRPGTTAGEASIPLWQLAASTAASVALLFCVHLVGSKMTEAKIAQEHDLA
jgi:hypothetical protein